MPASNQKIEVELEDWVEKIATHAAEKAAHCVLEQHRDNCPVDDHAERLGKLELRFAALVAFMAGSGLLGGVAGALVSQIWSS